MNAGEVNFSQHCGYEQIVEAYTGTGPFKSVGPQRNIRNLATSYGLPWTVHVVDPAVKTFADLKRRTVFVQVSHTDHITAMRVLLKSAGLDYNRDIKVIPFREPGEAVQGIAAGRGDAIAFGLIPSLVELHRSKGLHSIPISPELAKKVQDADPVWGTAVIRKGTGPLAPPEDVPVLAIECGMAAGVQTNAETVYQVLKAVYDNLADWKSVHPLANQTTLKKALQVVVVPFHDGAIRFYKEAGLWTPELDAKQKELLAK
jgi:TRAP transporter TAXI family solute receptor